MCHCRHVRLENLKQERSNNKDETIIQRLQTELNKEQSHTSLVVGVPDKLVLVGLFKVTIQ